MKIEDAEKIALLREVRQEVLDLHDAARDGLISMLQVVRGGKEYPVFPLLPREPFRSAIIETAADRLVALNKELAALGVSTPKFEVVEMDKDGWRRTAEMYLRAWIRELGGRLFNKTHLIDALVLTSILPYLKEFIERIAEVEPFTEGSEKA